MKKCQLLLVLSFLLLFSALSAQKSHFVKANTASFNSKNAMLAQIKKYHLFEMNQEELYHFAQKQQANAFEVHFQFDATFDWELVLKAAKVHGEDFNFITDKGKAIEVEKNITYEGYLKHAPDTKVRMTISKHYTFGLILDENRTTFETLKNNNAAKPLIVVYESTQLLPQEKSCGQEKEESIVPDVLKHQLTNTLQQRAFLPTTYCAKLGIVLDWQGLAKAGSIANFNTDIQTILNIVNGYYAVFNVQYELNPIYVISAAPNPWTDAPGAQSTLVANFRNWANPNLTPTNYNCALLFTGTNMNGIGYAYIGQMCQTDTYRFGEIDYQYVQPTTQRANLTTHELGHLWGAQHTSSSSTLIMSPSIWDGTLQWDAAASSVINTGVTTTYNSCLNNCTNFVVNWTNPTSNQVFTNLNPINFAANASISVGTVSKVDFYVNNVLLATDNTSPYNTTWTPSSYGNYLLKAVATNSSNTTLSQEITITVQNGQSITVNSQVNTSSDDAEQFLSTGVMNLTSSDLELADDGALQEVGMRFKNINVPKNAIITNAYIQFTVDETNSTTINLNIYGQDIGNAPTFTTTANNITSRTKTSPAVAWSPAAWTTIGATGVGQQTPNISSIIQQIVNRSDWVANNALVLFVNGGVRRTASAYDGVATEAPKLFITYTVNNVGVKVSPKVFLNNLNTTTALMPNDLTALSNFPLSDPYATAPMNSVFTHVNNPTIATTTPAVLATTGNNAIVDWLFLELRTGTSGSTSVAYTKAALLQRNGDVVATDGSSPVEFSTASAGNYYVCIRHHNNLGFRTANTVALTSTTTALNFTNNSIPLFGATPLVALAQNVYGMISGDANYDGSIDAFDSILWEMHNGIFDDYSKNSDYNLDGSIDALDSILWELNNGKFETLD